jgi:VWFA-related protein
LTRLTAVLAAVLTCALTAQQVFKSGVDVTQIDVTVVDRDGNPVSDLKAADFTVTVDGKPRTIVSAQFVSYSSAATSATTAASAPSRDYATNVQATPGRLIALVIDQGNIRMGGERSVLKAAEGLLDRLTPADRVALLTFPTPGPVVTFTGDLARVKEGLRHVVAQYSLPSLRHSIAATEALRIEDGDAETLAKVVERECGPRDASCPGQIAVDARSLAPQVRRRSLESLGGLRDVLVYLKTIDGPKTMALISEGLILDEQRFAQGLPPEIEHLAAQARATVYVLRLGAEAFEASEPRPFREMDQAAQTVGLETVAGVTGGEMLTVVGTGAHIFDRVAREIAATYLLAIETLEQDRDGKRHRIKVSVRRGRLQARARRELEASAAANQIPARSADHSAADDIMAALRAPLLASGLALRAASYVLHDADSGKVRVVVAADVGLGFNGPARVGLAYNLVDAKGAVVSGHAGPVTLRPGADGRLRYREEFALAPGDYTFKLAAADDAGHLGSIDRSVRAALTRIGPIAVADLVVNDEADAQRGAELDVEPVVDSGRLSCGVDLKTLPGALPRDVSVSFELVDAAGNVRQRAGAALASSEDGARHMARATLDVTTVAPGDYAARAVVIVSGERKGEVARAVRVRRR